MVISDEHSHALSQLAVMQLIHKVKIEKQDRFWLYMDSHKRKLTCIIILEQRKE